MLSGVRFVDDADPAGRPGDAAPDGDVVESGRPASRWSVALDAARQRHRRGLRRLGLVAGTLGAAAALTALVLASVPQDTVVAGQGTAGHAVAVSADPAAPAAVVRATATGALTDYVRQTSAAGACPTVRVGDSPVDAIAQAISTTLPGYRLDAAGRVLDEFTGLCSVRLRARGPDGAVLAVQVSSPDGATATPLGSRPYLPVDVGLETQTDGTATVWVSLDTAREWDVVVGAVGPSAALPSSSELQRLALDGALTW